MIILTHLGGHFLEYTQSYFDLLFQLEGVGEDEDVLGVQGSTGEGQTWHHTMMMMVDLTHPW